MRTTLDLGDDVLAAARAIAGERDISLGAAVSLLARRGLEPRIATDGLPTFTVSAAAPTLTPAQVARALDDA